MKYIIWIALNDGVNERVHEDQVDPADEARVIDQALLPVSLGERGRVGRVGSPFTVDGTISGKSALLRLWDGDAPLADIGICLHSRAAPGLWAELHRGDSCPLSDINRPAAEPWCAVRCYAPDDVLPPWFDNWTQTLAMALVRREGW